MGRWLACAVAVGVAATAVTGCSSNGLSDSVDTRAREDVDFTQYQTFAFTDRDMLPDDLPDDVPDDVEANLGLVEDSVRTQMTELGLTEVEPDEDPDLVVFNLAATEDNDAIIWQCVPGYWWGYWGWTWDPCAWLEPVYTEYTVGSIVVGLADPELEEVVFGGLLQGVADGGNDVEVRIDNAVRRMFQDYPAGQTGD